MLEIGWLRPVLHCEKLDTYHNWKLITFHYQDGMQWLLWMGWDASHELWANKFVWLELVSLRPARARSTSADVICWVMKIEVCLFGWKVQPSIFALLEALVGEDHWILSIIPPAPPFSTSAGQSHLQSQMESNNNKKTCEVCSVGRNELWIITCELTRAVALQKSCFSLLSPWELMERQLLIPCKHWNLWFIRVWAFWQIHCGEGKVIFLFSWKRSRLFLFNQPRSCAVCLGWFMALTIMCGPLSTPRCLCI